jgi:hypothetical protein
MMQLNFSNSKLNQLIVHYVGNKNNEDGYVLSNVKVKKQDKDTDALLVNYFLSPFKTDETFKFWHESEIKLNTLFSYVSDIFSDKKLFLDKSQNIAKHLYECSIHPNIKQGELYIAELTDVIYGEEVVNAIAIFKSENKDNFIQSLRNENHFEIERLSGTNLDKVDKAAIVFNTYKEDGYKILIIDHSNKSYEAAYWKDSFLKVTNCADEYFQTNQFLGIAKNFVTKQLDEEFEVTKADKIDLLNRSVEYFKTHETFDKKEFEEEVFQDSGIIKSFRNFDNTYRQENEIDITDSFEISPQAVKKQARVFKSVLKLDKNFHIYIHGNRDMIEQGVDKDGRKYYKIYYDQES